MPASHLALPLLALASLATAYDGRGDNVVVGSTPPWGIPATDFQQAISQSNATGLFTVPGFNLASTGSMKKTQDWTVHLSVRADVSLSKAKGDADKSKVSHLTSMSIDAPDNGVIVNKKKENSLCANILFGLNDKGTEAGQDDAEDDDGECAFLSKECRDDLESAAKDADGCADISIPSSCEDWISTSAGMKSFGMWFPYPSSSKNPSLTQPVEMTPKILGANRFFSFGSEPVKANDETEYAIAVTNIWPVLFSWHHSGSGSSASLRCMRADKIAVDSDEPKDVPSRGDYVEEKSGSDTDDSTNQDSSSQDDQDGAAGRNGPVLAGVFVAIAALCAVL